MLKRLIRSQIIEIAFVSLFVIVTVPIWHFFDLKISEAKAITSDNYHLAFDEFNYDEYKTLIVRNDYFLHKNYQIKLKVPKEVDLDKSFLTLNNKTYHLNDFTREERRSSFLFTIVDNSIMATIDYYKLEPKLAGKDIDYNIIFKEIG